MTQIMSREIVNTLTNPVHFHGDEIGAVTYDANNAINEPEEIGDLCDVASSVIDGVKSINIIQKKTIPVRPLILVVLHPQLNRHGFPVLQDTTTTQSHRHV